MKIEENEILRFAPRNLLSPRRVHPHHLQHKFDSCDNRIFFECLTAALEGK